MSFLVARKTIGFAIETVPYTKETLDAADYNIAAWDLNYSPEIAMKARKISRGDFGKEASVAGKRSITISFAVDCQEAAAADTEPTYAKCLRACGYKQTGYTTKGIGWVPDSGYSNVPATIEIVEKDEGTSPVQVVVTARGCMGNVKQVVNAIGEPLRYEFEFKGVLDSISDRAYSSIMTPTGFMTVIPVAVMGVSVTAYDPNTDVMTMGKVTIDLGNDVQLFSDPASAQGLSGAHIVDRTTKIDCDPDLLTLASQNFYSRWINHTHGDFHLHYGSMTTITASVTVNKAYAPGEREGHVVNNLTLNVFRDTLEIMQGAKA